MASLTRHIKWFSAALWVGFVLAVLSPAYGSAKVFIKQDPKNKSSFHVYVLNAAGKSYKFATVENVAAGHYHPAQFVNGQLYLIRRSRSDNDGWIDELWRYDAKGRSARIISNKGLDFRVSEDGKLIAVATTLEDAKSNILRLLQPSGKTIKTYEAKDLGMSGWFEFEDWTGRYLWLRDQYAVEIAGFVKVDTQTMAARRYQVSLQCQDYALHPASLKLAYSDYPVAFDVDSYDQFVESKQPVKLYVCDLVSGKSNVVATSVAKAFEPEWKDASTLEFENPTADGRITRRIP